MFCSPGVSLLLSAPGKCFFLHYDTILCQVAYTAAVGG
ncbi:hypothetical protein ECEC1846_4089 [Escherichia coli EC1846]|nr:hypothetical protein ECH7EC4501_2045 [Escherichia coli O157:H7 str. EC4501]EDU98050.1 hypothetical protein ECH7EC508_2884 [Escherichia coli O157:H7 str. EC508]EEC28516.1 hypothetical protein ESCCO14588_5520 [Escherichia coli O157:H7 str. TW14588]EHU72409.1 hypothetical protein ECDEC3D_3967 [Escherichia coli DEC3D]EIN21362.1 hypothetical protein ECFDA505_3985 [Escherichia coli FDA505]EIN51937.1 hypothetical protein ECPA3_4158 [Escherichia coli PA3]EIN55231.1 hypothetical protein ECPA5_4020 